MLFSYHLNKNVLGVSPAVLASPIEQKADAGVRGRALRMTAKLAYQWTMNGLFFTTEMLRLPALLGISG